jgi:ubiquinone/menaquinone biosynthesis C-methylase UbiE
MKGGYMSETAFQEVSVREGYALWAASYDQEYNGLIFVEEPQVDRLLAQLSFTRVLDAGTGTGRHALKLARRGANVIAFDQSPEMLAVASLAAQREVLPIDFHLLSLDDDLPFEADQFDLLICALTLSHVPNLAHALAEFARVLQDGGSLLITDFHPVHTLYGWEDGVSARRSEISPAYGGAYQGRLPGDDPSLWLDDPRRDGESRR